MVQFLTFKIMAEKVKQNMKGRVLLLFRVSAESKHVNETRTAPVVCDEDSCFRYHTNTLYITWRNLFIIILQCHRYHEQSLLPQLLLNS